jgi:hypothetical protein
MSHIEFVGSRETEDGAFYFRCYNRIIGVARNPTELDREMRRLAHEDPDALKYHLTEGHIVRWLYSINERELAEELDGVKNLDYAQWLVQKYLEKSMTYNRMHHGRMH